jgi:hypothetical protein
MIVYSNRSSSPLGNIGCLIFAILGLVALFYILKGLFYLLWWAAPVLFLLSLIINWRVAANTGKAFLDLLGRNPLSGLLLGALAIVGFPLLALYLFLGAIGNRQMENIQRDFGRQNAPETETEFTEYEELESTPKTSTSTADEPDVIEPEPEPEKLKKNPYDDLLQ